jgi:hypothetical protein
MEVNDLARLSIARSQIAGAIAKPGAMSRCEKLFLLLTSFIPVPHPFRIPSAIKTQKSISTS